MEISRRGSNVYQFSISNCNNAFYKVYSTTLRTFFDCNQSIVICIYIYVYNPLFFDKILPSNSFDPDQARHSVCPDAGPNCLQRVSADDKKVSTIKESLNHIETDRQVSATQCSLCNLYQLKGGIKKK